MNTSNQSLATNSPSHRIIAWSDAQLISAVRCDPPEKAALDALVTRYWDVVFRRCHKLTANHEKALDLAQAAWCRILQKRHMLKPDGNFPAFITMIATNLFRDSYRAARRAGPMADHQLESLDAPFADDGEDAICLGNILPDLNAPEAEEQMRLKIDINAALEQLTPQSRNVLVARFIEGESCAEIGLRHGRTEQAVSRWVREGLREMKTQMESPVADRTNNQLN